MTILDNSRAAFYFKRRARNASTPALYAWGAALQDIELRATLKARLDVASLAADTARAAYNAGDDKRRFAPLTVAMDAARTARARASDALHQGATAYGHSRADGYTGNWTSTGAMYFAADPESLFRDYQKAHDVGGADHTGWFDNPHNESARDGSGLVYGVTAQIAPNDGRARFIAGYACGSDENGAMFDMGTFYESSPSGEDWETARRDAARAGDGMAEKAADDMQEHATAWQAGNDWAELRETENATRRDLLLILAERRALPAMPNGSKVDRLCKVIRDEVQKGLRDIRKSRAKRRELMRGDNEGLDFYPTPALMVSFNEGAGV